MKKVFSLLLIALSVALTGFTQSAAPAEFLPGSVNRLTNESSTGTIKPMFKSRGVIVFVNASGKKEQLSPNDLAGFQLNNESYTSYASDFYKVLDKGAKMLLLQRVTDNSGKIFYNGSQAVSSTSLVGKTGDFYVQKNGTDEFQLVNADNFNTIVVSLFADCPALQAEVKSKQLGYEQLASAVSRYNACK